MNTITLYRRDFVKPFDGGGDFFNDIVINLELAADYDEAFNIDEVEIVVHQATPLQ